MLQRKSTTGFFWQNDNYDAYYSILHVQCTRFSALSGISVGLSHRCHCHFVTPVSLSSEWSRRPRRRARRSTRRAERVAMTTDYTAGAPLPDYAVYEVDKFGTLLEVDVAAVAGAAMVVDTPPQPTASPVLQQSVYVQNNDVRLADAAGTAAPSVVTKVIIAKTTAPTPVRLAPSGITLAHSAPREFCVLNRPGARLTRTPTKLVTAAGGGVLSPTRVLPATPPRQLAVSPLRTPTKITMVPISLARSPQQTAGGQVLTMVAAPQGRAGTAAGTLQPSLIGLSPSKLVLKAPHTMVMVSQAELHPFVKLHFMESSLFGWLNITCTMYVIL